MQKLLNFVGLLFSVVRLLWRALCFSWNHGGQLRGLTDELRAVIADGQLAVHGVNLGTDALKLANANSVEVQRFTDYSRTLLQTDLIGASLPTLTRAVAAATTELPQIHALRNELAALIDTAPLPGLTLRAAAKAVHTVAAQQPTVNALLADDAFVDAALAVSVRAGQMTAAHRGDMGRAMWSLAAFLDTPSAGQSQAFLQAARADLLLLDQRFTSVAGDVANVRGHLPSGVAGPDGARLDDARNRISDLIGRVQAIRPRIGELVAGIDHWLTNPDAATLSALHAVAAGLEPELRAIAPKASETATALTAVVQQAAPAVLAGLGTAVGTALEDAAHALTEVGGLARRLAERLALLALPPLEKLALQRIVQLLDVSAEIKPGLQDLATSVRPLIARDLAEPASRLASGAATVAAHEHARVRSLVSTLADLTAQPLAPEIFELTRKGSELVWTRSGPLLTLTNGAGGLLSGAGTALVTAGNGAVEASYVLNGREADNGVAIPPTVTSYPAEPGANTTLDLYNAVKLVDRAETLLSQVAGLMNSVTTALNGFVVKVPDGVEGDTNHAHARVPGTSIEVYSVYKAKTRDESPFSAVVTAPATTAMTTLHDGVVDFRAQVSSHSHTMFGAGVTLIEKGQALQQLAAGL